jgi:hypothetical protein
MLLMRPGFLEQKVTAIILSRIKGFPSGLSSGYAWLLNYPKEEKKATT